jgi:two-component system C4-dicarboxylate transport sensor histidine kinase DctB
LTYKRYFPFFFTVFALCAVILFLAGRFASQKGVNTLAEEGLYQLTLYSTYLQGVLEKYEALPELLATDERLVSFFLHPGSRERIDVLNQYLETVNRIFDAADTYLMDSEGLTIAASNWKAEHPFVGRNFSYRPYFQQAMRGRLGRYFALGTTSSRRGYYFAYPVRNSSRILGAVVIKINIDSVEKNWGHREEKFLVTDPDGVIFLTTEPDWRFHSILPLSNAVKERIIKSKRYPRAPLSPLDIQSSKSNRAGYRIISLRDNGEVREYLQQSLSMEHAGWQVHVLSETSTVETAVLRLRIVIIAAFCLLGLGFLMFWQRQQQIRERIQHEEQTRGMLQQANANLEQRVSERTKELTQANALLVSEIDDRKQTEEKLRLARSELVHTAKLATIGQMASGINHELNQPLAAIRSYADNGRKFLHKGRIKDALWNLDQIGELIERMAKIGSQLKIFSRKTRGNLSCLPLHGIVDGALEIVNPLLHKTGVAVKVSLQPDNIVLLANSVLLQQALVNVISNSIQAVQGQQEKRVQLFACYEETNVRITVSDNGPGITEEADKLFEPFYTTKPAGQGLGLGLTITRRIVEEMEGLISISSNAEGTTCILLLKKGRGQKCRQLNNNLQN